LQRKKSKKSVLIIFPLGSNREAMSFWRMFMSKTAGMAEAEIERKLSNSPGFRQVVHTVTRKGIRDGGKDLLKEAAPGASRFSSIFLDELKADLGFTKRHVEKKETKALPRVEKRQ
jgi:hypothetical protein